MSLEDQEELGRWVPGLGWTRAQLPRVHWGVQCLGICWVAGSPPSNVG